MHVLWDWNGTLLDDTRAALDTLNLMIAKRGAKPISMGFYRDHFAFPVRPFYEQIGIVLENEVWNDIAKEYHDTYALQPKHINAGAEAALRLVRERGAKQSIISALRQDLLDGDVARYGLRGYFEYVYGVDNLDGFSKLRRARELKAQIGDDDDIVMIGDALHDKEVADDLGVRCVLCAQGSHSAWRLERVAPTGETLEDAVRLAFG